MSQKYKQKIERKILTRKNKKKQDNWIQKKTYKYQKKQKAIQ